jgi:DinB family protein/adenylate cyclase associated (CAP) protein
MEIESPGFTEDDLRTFFDEVVAYERTRPNDGRTLVERLEAASNRLEQVVGSIGPGGGRQAAPDGGWTARETLAHIVLVSQVLGWATWAVASGEQNEITIMSFLSLRDVAGEHFAKVSAQELLEIAQGEHLSTIEYLCMADAESLARRAKVGPFELSAEEIGRLMLCAHLELHIEQLESALGTRRRSGATA